MLVNTEASYTYRSKCLALSAFQILPAIHISSVVAKLSTKLFTLIYSNLV